MTPNIARGTADTGIDSTPWSYLINGKSDHQLQFYIIVDLSPVFFIICEYIMQKPVSLNMYITIYKD